MKYHQIAQCYRKMILILINKGFVEEMIPPKTNLQVRVHVKKSKPVNTWRLVIPSDGLTFTIEDGAMKLHHVNKRTGYECTRDFERFITTLDYMRNYEAVAELNSLLAVMRWHVKQLNEQNAHCNAGKLYPTFKRERIRDLALQNKPVQQIKDPT